MCRAISARATVIAFAQSGRHLRSPETERGSRRARPSPPRRDPGRSMRRRSPAAVAPMIATTVPTFSAVVTSRKHVIWPRVRAQDRPVVAQPAAHVERPHAVGAHVAEGHRRACLGPKGV
jgi:hypothetical protein